MHYQVIMQFLEATKNGKKLLRVTNEVKRNSRIQKIRSYKFANDLKCMEVYHLFNVNCDKNYLNLGKHIQKCSILSLPHSSTNIS